MDVEIMEARKIILHSTAFVEYPGRRQTTAEKNEKLKRKNFL